MYHLDLYLRKDKGRFQEVAKFIDPLRNYKAYNKDCTIFSSDYDKSYSLKELINLIDRCVDIEKKNVKHNLIFLVSTISEDHSFYEKTKYIDRVHRKSDVPEGIKLKKLFSVRYDFIEKCWYVMMEPNDEGRWAGGLKYNPYDKWEYFKYEFENKENGV